MSSNIQRSENNNDICKFENSKIAIELQIIDVLN